MLQDSLCSFIGSWCNGNTSDFDSGILGSNPGGPTKQSKNKMNLAEEYHIPDEKNIDKQINHIFDYLYWDLCRQVVEGTIHYEDEDEDETSILDEYGKTFNELVSDIVKKRKSENVFKFPIQSSNFLTHEDNACSSWLGDDTEYLFIIKNSFVCQGESDTDTSYFVDGVLCGSKITITIFYGQIDKAREVLRHELCHLYEQSKKKDTGERVPEYSEIVKLWTKSRNAKAKSYEDSLILRGVDLYCECLYRLFKEERSAYLSSFVETAKRDLTKSYKSNETYLMYSDLLDSVSFGVDIFNSGHYVTVDVLMNDTAFDKVRRYFKAVFNKSPKIPVEAKEIIQNELKNVLKRMQDVWYHLTTEQKTSGERYEEAEQNKFDERLEENVKWFGEEKGYIKTIYEVTTMPGINTDKFKILNRWFKFLADERANEFMEYVKNVKKQRSSSNI